MTNRDGLANREIYCGNLAPQVTEELLFELFLQVGPVEDARIVKSLIAPPFGFIKFESAEATHYACLLFDGLFLCGRPLKVKPKTNGGDVIPFENTSSLHLRKQQGSHLPNTGMFTQTPHVTERVGLQNMHVPPQEIQRLPVMWNSPFSLQLQPLTTGMYTPITYSHMMYSQTPFIPPSSMQSLGNYFYPGK